VSVVRTAVGHGEQRFYRRRAAANRKPTQSGSSHHTSALAEKSSRFELNLGQLVLEPKAEDVSALRASRESWGREPVAHAQPAVLVPALRAWLSFRPPALVENWPLEARPAGPVQELPGL
jgi:hypothetical protein